MISEIRAWIAGKAVMLLAGALAITVLGLAVQTWRVSSLKAANATLQADVKAAKEATRISEGLRAQEQADASASYGELSNRCEQRVSEARDAAQAIGEIINANGTNDGGSRGADRGIVPAGQLRRVIGQD